MTEVTIAHGTTAEEMAAWTREYETKIPQIKKGLVPHVMMGGGAQVDIVNGQPVVKHHFEGTAMATPGLRPGHVVIGGIETTIEGAIASGLMTPEDRVPPRGVAGYRWSPVFSGRVGLFKLNLKDTTDDRRHDEPALTR